MAADRTDAAAIAEFRIGTVTEITPWGYRIAWGERLDFFHAVSTTKGEDAMNTNSPEFTSLLSAALWWRDYAMNLAQGSADFPTSPYPPLYEYTPAPPPGVTAEVRGE